MLFWMQTYQKWAQAETYLFCCSLTLEEAWLHRQEAWAPPHPTGVTRQTDQTHPVMLSQMRFCKPILSQEKHAELQNTLTFIFFNEQKAEQLVGGTV